MCIYIHVYTHTSLGISSSLLKVSCETQCMEFVEFSYQTYPIRLRRDRIPRLTDQQNPSVGETPVSSHGNGSLVLTTGEPLNQTSPNNRLPKGHWLSHVTKTWLPQISDFFLRLPSPPLRQRLPGPKAARLLSSGCTLEHWGSRRLGKGGGKQKLIRDITRPGKHTKSYWKWPSRNSGFTH